MRRWAEFVLKHRKWVIGFWLLVIVGGGMAAGTATSRMTVDFSLPGQPGSETAHQIKQSFHGIGGDVAPFVATLTMPQGQTVTGNEAAVARAFEALGSTKTPVRLVDEANTGDRAFRTKDDRTAYALAFYAWDANANFSLPTDGLRAAAQHAAPPGATVGMTGYDVLSNGGDDSGGNGVLVEVLLGAGGALVVLAFAFGSFLALLPLVVAAGSIMATFAMLLPLTYLTDVSFIVQFLVALIGLGVAIDYSLLFVTRWREERDHGRDNHEAVVVAMQTAGHAVIFSGVTVAIGLLALVVLPVPFMRSMGYGGALIPVASVAATLSFTPAILGGIGPKIDWPKIRHENRASRWWTGWASGVVKHRWVAAIVAAGVLALMFLSFTGVKIGLANTDSLATGGAAYETRQQLLAGDVPPGVLTPMEVLVKSDSAAAVRQALSGVDGVAGAYLSTGPGQTADGYSIVTVVPKTETVNSQSMDVVKRVKRAVDKIPGAVGVAGLGAAQIDFMEAVYGNFPLMLTVIALLTLVLLIRAFRSILLPVKAVLLNVLSVAAVLGAMTWFWQNGHGSDALFGISATGAITFWIPIMVFAFLFGLSMDYEVFILSRIREEYDGTRNTDAAVVEGMARTGRLVTSAALILFLAFAALATGPGTDTKVMATGLGIGILLDATVVRSLLVPSLVSLFGRWNWWLPASVARLLRVEPSVAVPEPTRAERVPTLVE